MLDDLDLIALLTKTEDSYVERKPTNRKQEWLRTVVAFANSTPIGYPAVLFIGVNDAGQIADGVNIERVMKSFSDFLEEHAWPPVYTLPKSLTHQGKTCVAVIVPGSTERPHFAGKSYVRLGTQTKEASEQQFSELIAQRNSKTRELLSWVGKRITVVHMRHTPADYHESYPQNPHDVVTCNAYYLTIRVKDSSGTELSYSFPLNWIELGFDHEEDRLKAYIYFDR